MAKKKQYYFLYNGRKIEPGAILKIKPWQGIEEIIFERYVPEADLYVFRYRGKNGLVGSGMHGNEFKEHFLHPTYRVDEYVAKEHQMKMENWKLTFSKEIQIEGMLFAWVIYIILMGLTLIFNGFFLYWILISVCFFIYRHGKLKDAGYKD